MQLQTTNYQPVILPGRLLPGVWRVRGSWGWGCEIAKVTSVFYTGRSHKTQPSNYICILFFKMRYKTTMWIRPIAILLLLSKPACAQLIEKNVYCGSQEQIPDTTIVKASQLRISWRKCKRILFNKGYSYWGSNNGMERQIMDHQYRYLVIYNKQGHLRYEGFKGYYSGFCGDVKFYKRNGRLKTVGNYSAFDFTVVVNNGKDTLKNWSFSDSVMKDGTWRHYDSQNRLKKEKIYNIALLKENYPIKYCRMITINRYDKKGHVVQSRKRKKWTTRSWGNFGR
ncbi:MAG: hypothetical protein KDD36_03515 [Flavobacteriales bacterium]|nr:hypothetical protein [Flavobacteriales bacterium]